MPCTLCAKEKHLIENCDVAINWELSKAESGRCFRTDGERVQIEKEIRDCMVSLKEAGGVPTVQEVEIAYGGLLSCFVLPHA